MRLRPHHLLCTQGYEGKGYSEDFTANMTALTERLRSGGDMVISLVFSTDDICEKCPNMLGTDLCKSNDQVRAMDRKVADYFRLREKSYIYGDLLREIDLHMTEAILDDICSSCGWYSCSACKMRIIHKRKPVL